MEVPPKSTKAQYILDRLSQLEESQFSLMDRMQAEHNRKMAELREKLEAARHRRDDEQCTALINPEPLLMQVNMTEVEAAVQAASFAEQESAQALVEARKVADDARSVSGGMPQVTREAVMKDADVDYGADSEYIVKKVSVNLDEVERAIGNSSYVSVCRAFGLPDAKYGNEVYCAVVPKSNVKVSEPMLFIHAQKYLPTAMVPKRFYFLSDLPSGITRKALADTQMKGGLGQKPLAAFDAPNGIPAIEN